MRSADVEGRKPSHARFERRMDRRRDHDLAVALEGAEEGSAIGNDRRVERRVARDAMGAGANWIPRRTVTHGFLQGTFHEVTALDEILDINYDGPVSLAEQT